MPDPTSLASAPYHRIIRATRSTFGLDWQRLLHYRDLLGLLVRRDFVARYQQTVLGPVWFVLQPLIATVAFTFVFNRGLGTSTDGIQPAYLFYMCGMLPWSLFSNVLSGAGNTFQSNAGVFTKVYFPRLIVPIAVTLGGLVPFALQLVLFLGCYGVALLGGHALAPSWLALALLPLGILQLTLLALGVSLLTSGLSAKYRDLQHALPFFIQMGLFVTPVIYPVSQLGAQTRLIAAFNPLTPLVELFRLAFFGVGTVTLPLVAMSFAGTVFALVVGLWWFQRAERTFADTV